MIRTVLTWTDISNDEATVFVTSTGKNQPKPFIVINPKGSPHWYAYPAAPHASCERRRR